MSSKKFGLLRSTWVEHRKAALPIWVRRMQHTLITRIKNWQVVLKRVVIFTKNAVQKYQSLNLDLGELCSYQAFRLYDQGRKWVYYQIWWSNRSNGKGIDRIWDPIKEEELSSSPVWSPVVKWVFLPLRETNRFELSSQNSK